LVGRDSVVSACIDASKEKRALGIPATSATRHEPRVDVRVALSEGECAGDPCAWADEADAGDKSEQSALKEPYLPPLAELVLRLARCSCGGVEAALHASELLLRERGICGVDAAQNAAAMLRGYTVE
jgi:hypothetical protein